MASSPAGRYPLQAKKHDSFGVWVGIATIVAIGLAELPGLAALIALRSTNQQVSHQLQIAEQGQITDRYNAAITNLGSRSIEVRLGAYTRSSA